MYISIYCIYIYTWQSGPEIPVHHASFEGVAWGQIPWVDGVCFVSYRKISKQKIGSPTYHGLINPIQQEKFNPPSLTVKSHNFRRFGLVKPAMHRRVIS